MPDSPSSDSLLALVHEGWDHLKRQRPLAAWASWRRVLRIEPEHKAATHALDVLANAGDLPISARAEYRFLVPVGEDQRRRWDERFRRLDLGELADASEAYRVLADGPPDDAQARFNQGLCLAWLGQNAKAVEALDLAVRGLAEHHPDEAAAAWTLAEVLRQGGGAETLADDLSPSATFSWTLGDDPAGFLDTRDDVRPIPNPLDPVTGRTELSEARLYEWLERLEDDLHRVRATVVRRPGSLRLSGTDPALLEEAIAEVSRLVGDRNGSIRREATPLPLAFLDAPIWAIRMPPGLDEETQDRLNRGAVERYYESVWIHRPRRGLDGRSPIEMGRAASAGDPVAMAKLAAVVLLREQLGSRPTTALLYQGYPFDRLRRRLGLATTDPEAIDPADPASMSGPELDRIDPAALDDYTLADAFESAAALGDDRRTARFAEALAARDPSAMARIDVRALFATLVRREIADDSPTGALGRIDRAQEIDRALTGGRDHRAYETWRAEVFVRTGSADEAVRVYQALIHDPLDPALALDAAEMLHDAGFEEHARAMASIARNLADTIET